MNFCYYRSVVQSCPIPCNPMDCSTPGFPVLHHLLELAQTHIHWVSDALWPSHPLSSPSPPVLNLSQHPRVFSSELAIHIRWPKYWSFSFSIGPSNEYSGLISFRIDWFDLLAVQGTLKSLLQHHRLKASILWCSAFFMIQLSHHLFLRVLTQVTMENLNKFNGIKNQNLGLVKGHCKQRPHLQEDIHWWKVRPWTTERMRTDQQEQRTTAEKSKTVRDVS